MGDVLIKYDGSWADEIDLQGFLVMTRDEWKQHLSLVKKYHGDEEFTLYVGTNEDMTFRGFEDYKDSFDVKNITDEEAKVFRKFFKNTFSFWDPIKKEKVKVIGARNGVITWFEVDKLDWEELEESETEEQVEESA